MPLQSLSPADVLAITLWGEARSEPVEGRIAIANVVRNRVSHPGWWGTDYVSVCRAPQQFSCWNAGDDANHAAVMALLADVWAGKPAEPIYRECLWIADGVMRGLVCDRIGKATHYFASSIAPPAWSAKAHLVARIGNHLFYAGVQ